MRAYQKGKKLKLTFKDRMEDSTTWNAFVLVDEEGVDAVRLENKYGNSFLIDVEELETNEEYVKFSEVKKVYK